MSRSLLEADEKVRSHLEGLSLYMHNAELSWPFFRSRLSYLLELLPHPKRESATGVQREAV